MKPLPLLLFLALFSTRLFAATADTPAAAATPAGQESLYERSEAQIKAGYDKMQTRESRDAAPARTRRHAERK